MPIARPDVTAGLPERDPPTCCASYILKEAVVKLPLGRLPLTTWVPVASITDEFILELDVLRPHDASLGLKCYVL